MNIEQADDGTNGTFFIKEDDTVLAEMTYRHSGNNIIIDHTEVDPRFRNKGIGNKLVSAGIAYARKNNLRIKPLCPFAKIILESTPEYSDVLA